MVDVCTGRGNRCGNSVFNREFSKYKSGTDESGEIIAQRVMHPNSKKRSFTLTMFQNYLKLALRNLRKNKTFSVINLLGLAFGLAASIAVLLYVQDETSFEKFHAQADRIVRVNTEMVFDGNERKLGTAPNVLASFLQERLPEVAVTTIGRVGTLTAVFIRVTPSRVRVP